MFISTSMVRVDLTKPVKKILEVESVMLARSIITVAGVLVVVPALAAELKPEQARQFIAGKHFSYSCFEGSTGSGRVNPDGSVVGTIQVRGSGPVHFVTLPTGTIKVEPNSICANVRGLLFQPCFAVNQIDARSFRGSISGLGFAYCDFTRRNPRLEVSTTTSPPTQPADTSMMRTSISE
jgi:hypothetical protein